MSMFCGYSLGALIERGLTVGSNFNMQPDCFIDYSHCWLITIGNEVVLAPRVHILAHDASMLNLTGYTKVGRVTIGDRVFIGNNAMILPGVTIGSNVIIGAGSVVTRDIPDNSVAVGNPARVVCSIDEFVRRNKEGIDQYPNFDLTFTLEGEITQMQKDHMYQMLDGQIGYIKVF